MALHYWREALLVSTAVISLATTLLFVAPIPQDLRYHAFADGRAIFGVPNFADVVSNLPFLWVGAAGLVVGARCPGLAQRASWIVLFAGTALVAFGSAYYHLAPDNSRLMWDRLPMAVAFMGLFVALLGEYLHSRIERWLLAPAVLFGMGSVVYWRITDDLRLYAWVQFCPLLCLIAVVLLFQAARRDQRYLAGALGLYLTAKAAEFGDNVIFQISAGYAGGHAFKHLLAAGSCYVLYRMMRVRCAGGDSAPRS